MKKLNLTERCGFAQIFVLIGMLLIAISLPIATKLVQQNQENRSNAREVDGATTNSKQTVVNVANTVAKSSAATAKAVADKAAADAKAKAAAAAAAAAKTAATVKTTSTSSTTTTKSSATSNVKDTVTKSAASVGTVTKETVADTAIKATSCSTNGAIKCIGSGQIQQCILSNWTDATKCASGICNASGSGCGGTVPSSTSTTKEQTTPTPICSSSHCGSCSQSTCNTVGCLWGYNGSSTMYCYARSAAVPRTAIADCSSKCGECATVTACSASAANCTWSYSGNYCEAVSTGTCGVAINACTSGTPSDIADSIGSYLWMCGNKTCSINKPVCDSKCGDCATVAACSASAAKCIWSYSGNYCGTDYADNTCGTEMNTCVKGTLSDISDTNLIYLWMCGNKTCSVAKPTTVKTGGSGGSGGGSSSGSSSSFSVIPNNLTLKVGETAILTATEDAYWYGDSAVITVRDEHKTTHARGLVTALSVGSGVAVAAPMSANGVGVTVTVPVKVIAGDTRTLSFKVAFAGIKPSYVNSSGESYSCIGSLGNSVVEVLNRPTNVYGEFSDVSVSVVGNEVDSKGNQVFQVSNLEIDSSFASVNNFNYVKVKGPFHLKRRMCQDGQTGKLDETTTCDINLMKTDGYVYDFSEYTLLAGDVDSSGVINSIDYSLVKNAVNADAEPSCGREYDLNMDGVVNALDLNLVKDALSSIDDE